MVAINPNSVSVLIVDLFGECNLYFRTMMVTQTGTLPPKVTKLELYYLVDDTSEPLPMFYALNVRASFTSIFYDI